MIKKIRRQRIVIREKEIIVVKNHSQTARVCPVCQKALTRESTPELTAGAPENFIEKKKDTKEGK